MRARLDARRGIRPLLQSARSQFQATGSFLRHFSSRTADLPVERRRVDAEDGARALLLPVRVLEHLQKILLLEFVERDLGPFVMRLVRASPAGGACRGATPPGFRRVLEDNGTLDDVLELATFPGQP